MSSHLRGLSSPSSPPPPPLRQQKILSAPSAPKVLSVPSFSAGNGLHSCSHRCVFRQTRANGWRAGRRWAGNPHQWVQVGPRPAMIRATERRRGPVFKTRKPQRPSRTQKYKCCAAMHWHCTWHCIAGSQPDTLRASHNDGGTSKTQQITATHLTISYHSHEWARPDLHQSATGPPKGERGKTHLFHGTSRVGQCVQAQICVRHAQPGRTRHGEQTDTK